MARAKMREHRPVRLWQVAALAILVLGTSGITAGTWVWYGSNKDHNRSEFQARADQIATSTKQTLAGFSDQIASVRTLFVHPGLITRAEFSRYVEDLDLYRRYRGIAGLGVISWVPAEALPGFVAGWRADGEPAYTVAPAGSRPAYCLASHFEHRDLHSSIALIGYDLCTVAPLFSVLNTAATTGKDQAVAEVALANVPAFRGNFVLASPIYSGDPTTVAERLAQRTGWVATLIDGRQVLKSALGPADAHLGVELFAGPRVSSQKLDVASARDLPRGAAGSVTEHFTSGGTWTMRIYPLPGGPGPTSPLEVPGLVFLMAMALNMALAWFVWDLGRGRLRAVRSYMESERRFQSMASCSPVGILELAGNGSTLYVNRRLNEIAGIDEDFWTEGSWLDCVHPEDRAAVLAIAQSAWTIKDDTGASFRLLRPSGEVRNVRVLAAPVTGGDGEPSSFVATVQDVTDEVAATETLAFQAMHDSLTLLPNRALFLDRLGVELAHSARSGSDLAVMFLDLDRFKVINDGMGHQAGDELLKAVANRLLGVVRAGETVARLGGDEFTFIFHDVLDAATAATVAERILDALAEPIEIEGREVAVTGSIGIVFPGPGADASAVLRDADAGMYRAKESGRARFAIFDEHQRRAVLERLTIETELRQGIERGELRVHYQPLVSLTTGSVFGAEAFVRWEHPTRGILLPHEFLPVAEETGLIVALGEFVFKTAAGDCARWDRSDAAPTVETLAINVSARQLASPRLCPVVRDVLHSEGVDPGRISIEVTESVVMSDNTVTRRSLADLRNLGVGVAVDDFGRGYSSLASLSDLSLSAVKIDKSFVDQIGFVPDGGPIVVAVIEMAHALGLRVGADGVNAEQQRAFLVQSGCDLAQGDLWSRALPADEFALWWKVAVSDHESAVPLAR
jgi:diguanylate cyclase (GGDEF)-like protein/PAS domain S-box-containing protein